MDQPVKCQACRSGEPLSLSFTMAFQPIVDCRTGEAWAYEALVRGPDGQGAGYVLDQVDETILYKFDQACRVKAIELAGRLFPRSNPARLSINFMPNAVYEPAACIRATLEAARRVQFDPRRIVFEFTEGERMTDVGHVERIIAEYRRLGFATAIDDFGSGYSGLNLLTHFQPDILKIDMNIVRGIEGSAPRRAIVEGILTMARALDITVIAEGVETHEELGALREAGIELFQGYYVARPMVEALPDIRSIIALQA